MPTLITVTRKRQVEALLDIENPEFGHWYELGVWWALNGVQQGKGHYEDTYLIDNVERGLTRGYYREPGSPEFHHFGFYLGMIHGGYLNSKNKGQSGTESLVILTDPDFTKGYWVGRDYYYTEALPEGRIFSDTLFCQAIHEWALDFREWPDSRAVLAYCLGCCIGEMSCALKPEMLPATAPEGVTSPVL